MRYLPGAIVGAVLGIIVDMPLILVVAICKGPYMLFKGWKCLFHDLIGREGPFLETICVPFASLAIVLWPLAIVGGSYGICVSYFRSWWIYMQVLLLIKSILIQVLSLY